jgi:hypothetical protein
MKKTKNLFPLLEVNIQNLIKSFRFLMQFRKIFIFPYFMITFYLLFQLNVGSLWQHMILTLNENKTISSANYFYVWHSSFFIDGIIIDFYSMIVFFQEKVNSILYYFLLFASPIICYFHVNFLFHRYFKKLNSIWVSKLLISSSLIKLITLINLLLLLIFH